MRKTIDFKGEYRTYENCNINVGSYSYDPLCLYVRLDSPTEGSIAPITVNLGHDIGNESLIRENQAFIDANNCPEAIAWLEENDLAKPVTRFGEPVIAYSGWCEYPLYEFDYAKLREFDPAGWDEHVRLYMANWKKILEEMFG